MSAQPDDIVKKIAQMVAIEVPQKQIAYAVGLEEETVAEIVATDEFNGHLQEQLVEEIEKQQVLNQGWDMVENLSINHIIEHMQVDPDPDFALRAAQVANKATRRGGNRVTPIEGRAGVRTVITLNATYVNKVQNNNLQVENKRASYQLEKKGTNYLAPAMAEKLLEAGHRDKEVDFLEELNV